MASATGSWGVVVARTGPTAKSRLAEVLSADERSRLALAMLEDVLAACAGSALSGVTVVSDSAAARAVAEGHEARWVPDPGGGMNAAVTAGLRSCRAVTALVLPGDIPLLRAADVDAIVGGAGEEARAVVVVPDRADRGTNALLLRPPDVMAPAFGPDSAAQHFALARASRARAFQIMRPDVALDLDLPEDVARLLARGRVDGATGAFLDTVRERWELSSASPR
jgi:2-phospho-L-lactate/phosphoenolpyruvate guanylyltransferase